MASQVGKTCDRRRIRIRGRSRPGLGEPHCRGGRRTVLERDRSEAAYLAHGETYFREDEEIFWAKGGTMTGESPARIAFLRHIVDESPTRRIHPLGSDWDVPWGGVADQDILSYFGVRRPLFRNVSLPDGRRLAST